MKGFAGEVGAGWQWEGRTGGGGGSRGAVRKRMGVYGASLPPLLPPPSSIAGLYLGPAVDSQHLPAQQQTEATQARPARAPLGHQAARLEGRRQQSAAYSAPSLQKVSGVSRTSYLPPAPFSSNHLSRSSCCFLFTLCYLLLLPATSSCFHLLV